MKNLLMIFAGLLISTCSMAQVSKNSTPKPNPNQKLLVVEASCGECNFGLEGESCDLAIRIDGKAYFVDGASIYDFGGPHDKGGFCVAVRKAEVQGKIVGNRFKATYFKLLSKTEANKK